MSEDDRPALPGYVSIKEAAKILGISEKTVYFYVNSKRLPATWAADVLMIPQEEVERFELKPVGRPRKNTPPWLMSTGDNTLLRLSIIVQIRPGQQGVLKERLAQMKQSTLHIFPGTIDRSISESLTSPGRIEIQLLWRSSALPDEKTRAMELEAFQQSLVDLLDWSTAQYDNSQVLLHT